MHDTQQQKVVAVINPVAIVDNASWTTNEIDTMGYDYCTVYFMLGANDIGVTALKVQESDTSGSGMADVTGLVYGAAGAPALPSATDDNGIFAFFIDLKKRKRYLDVVATNGDGTVGGFAAAWAVLSRAAQMPNTAATRGLVAQLIV